MHDVNEQVELSPLMLFLLFSVTLFLVNYYELFFILEPIRSGEFGKRPTLPFYFGFNFFPKILFYVIKFFALTGIMYCTSLILNIKNQSTVLRKLVGFIILSEFLLLAAKLYKILYFEFAVTKFSIEDYNEFYHLSLYNSNGSGLVNHMLKDFGLFDLVYMYILYVSIKATYGISKSISIKMLLLSYVVPLMIWIAFIRYLGF